MARIIGYMLIMAAPVIIALVPYYFFKVAGEKRNLLKDMDGVRELLARINNKDAEIMPMKGLVSGITEKRRQEVESQLAEWSERLLQLLSHPMLEQGFILRVAPIHKVRQVVRYEVYYIAKGLDELRPLLERLLAAEKVVRSAFNEERDGMKTARAKLEKLKESSGFELRSVFVELDRIGAQVDKTAKVELFDPIGAEDSIRNISAMVDHVERLIEDAERSVEKCNNLPVYVESARAEIKDLVEEHQIHKAAEKLNVENYLLEADSARQEIIGCLQRGEISKALHYETQAVRNLSRAIKGVKEMAELRVSTQRMLYSEKESKQKLSEEFLLLREDIDQAELYYTRSSLEDVRKLEQNALLARNTSEQRLLNLLNLSSDEQQQYDSVEHELKELRRELGEWRDGINQARQMLANLSQKLEAQREERELYRRYREEAIEVARNAGIHWSKEAQELTILIDSEDQVLQDLLQQKPYDLPQINAHVNKYTSSIYSLMQFIKQTAAHKERVIQTSRSLDSQFQHALQVSSSMLNRRNYKKVYKQHSTQFILLLDQGDYGGAESVLQNIQQLINQMNQEYYRTNRRYG